MDISGVKQDLSELKSSYHATEGEMECFSFSLDEGPVYYRRVGDLMVSYSLDQMVS